ncbi:MAG: hypothetical protein AAFV59_14875 [Pseudomonadota bacterium]
MTMWSIFRVLLLAIASLGYFANGAQAHVHISPGGTISVMMCSTDHARTIEMELPSQPVEETEDTCCGDCTSTGDVRFTSPVMSAIPVRYAMAHFTPASDPISPRSPLWPGAPPHGPPTARKV